MTVYISLLRGINVGGSKIISMDTLCDIYSGLGYSYLRTYLQSGNVIFASPLADRLRLAGDIEARIEHVCGFHVAVFIRQVEDFRRLIQDNPFLRQHDIDPARLHVSFLYQAPAEIAWNKLDVPRTLPDRLSRGNMAIYLYYPLGYAKAKISTSYLEKVLAVPITNRNWNTVTALYNIALVI